MTSAHIIRRTDTMPEQARDVRARAWAFVFACFEKHRSKEGGSATAQDARKESNGSRKPIVQD